MIAIIATVLFAFIAMLTLLVACGLPLGEFTMGGQHKVLPKNFRIMAAVSFGVQIFAIIIVLQAGGFISLWFSLNATKYICIFFAVYLSLNTIMNLFSKSKKERYAMTPLSLLSAVCYFVTAFSM
ncbi:MAG: hypothetical protein FWH01_08760 [Oscillospiraceae bacterium]|nr:hypothetical protein [Oscillospiraceae bacterium]